VVVDAGPLLDGELVEAAVVRVLPQQRQAAAAHEALEALRHGGLARARAARHAQHEGPVDPRGGEVRVIERVHGRPTLATAGPGDRPAYAARRPGGDWVAGIDFGIYVPQLAYSYEDMLMRAQLCERLGFRSFWLFDHLYGPYLPTTDALE